MIRRTGFEAIDSFRIIMHSLPRFGHTDSVKITINMRNEVHVYGINRKRSHKYQGFTDTGRDLHQKV